jgi:NTE family protein
MMNVPSAECARPVIGIALGGGFALGIAHIGVLRELERNGIPIDRIAGVSAGAIVAGAYASGSTLDELAEVALRMRLSDIAGFNLSRFAFATTSRMTKFLRRILKCDRFEEMRMPACAVATDLASGDPVIFRGCGDVITPIRSSCAYPGVFRPVEYEGRNLIDGAFSMEMPVAPLRLMGATRVIAVQLAGKLPARVSNVFELVNRCFRIQRARTETIWRRECDVVIEPDAACGGWRSFDRSQDLIAAGEGAAVAALPTIREWLAGTNAR